MSEERKFPPYIVNHPEDGLFRIGQEDQDEGEAGPQPEEEVHEAEGQGRRLAVTAVPSGG